MHPVSAAPAASKPARWFHLDIECNGRPFCWTGAASDTADATRTAYSDLEEATAMFTATKARVVACVETGP